MATTLESWRKSVSGWPRAQTALAVGLVLAVLVAVVAWLALRGHDQAYAPLFSDLQPSDAAAVVQALDAEHEPYKLGSDGTAVLVPQADVYKLRLDLASQGLPNTGSVGFEVMDKLGLASTDFDRQVALLRATQGELERTIEQINGVRSARVHIVMPKETVFAGESQPASAAVLVEMKPGQQLNAAMVQGVVHLVSASVADLSPDQVTVLDQNGHVLSTPDGSGGKSLATAGTQLDLQQQFEQTLQQRLQKLLEQIFGPGEVATQVTAQLNFDQTTKATDFFTPADGSQTGLLLKDSGSQETTTGQSGGAGGVPGDSNLPTYPAAGSGNSSSSSSTEQHDRTYALNETTTTTTVAPGTVQRLSVAVVVDKPLTAQQQQQVQATVAAAIGSDPSRSDQISVISMPFDHTLLSALQQSEETPAPSAAAALPTWAYAAAGGLVLLFLLIAVLALRSRAAAKRRLDEELAMVAAARNEAQERRNGVADHAADTVVRDLKQHAREKPEQVARALRAWMVED